MHDPLKIARALSRQLKKTVRHLEIKGPDALSDKKDKPFETRTRQILRSLIRDQKKLEAELEKSLPDGPQLSRLIKRTDAHMQDLGELIVNELKDKLPEVE